MRLLFNYKLSMFSEIIEFIIMKRIKKIDFGISITLIIICTICSFTGILKNLDYPFFIVSYFIVGGWQVLSMIIHAYNHWFTYGKGKRYIYHWVTLIAVCTMPLGSFCILLFTAPFMAIYYTCICYEEAYIKMRCPLAILK